MAIPREAVQAASKYGPQVDKIAAQYTNPVTGKRLTGKALLLKLSKGENAFKMGGAPSSAGARGATQFTPGSRQVAISKFGVDPWKDYDQAFHAAALHLLGKINGSTGLHGYNPGMASYPSYILNQRLGKVGGGATGTAPSVPRASGSPAATPTTTTPGVDNSGLRRQLAAQYLTQKSPTSSGLVNLAVQLRAAQDVPGTTQPSASTSQPRTVTPKRSNTSGRVDVAPGAERPGIGLQKPILGFLNGLSASMGRPVQVTTGTNHNRMTTTGNVSDHWAGNAADLGVPVDSQKGDLIAAHAIANAGGVPFGRALAMARKGGVFNFNTKQGRVQILWRTMVGGNHHNHVHIGLNPGR